MLFQYSVKELLLGPNLDLKLLRRLTRWDLHDPRLFSSAAVYDVTFCARGSLFQTVQFKLREELQGKKNVFSKN